MKAKDNNRSIEVHTMSVEDFNKQYPAKCEIFMSPLPEGYVAKLASIHLVNTL